MYTELKELINFLAIYMHHRIPRRRICLLMESYSNHLAGRFLGKWKPEEPEYGEKERTLMIKAGDCLDQILSTIATSIGIVEEDLAACFPSLMIAYCNPGIVSCQVMNYAHMITVWMGDVNADVNFTPIPDGIAFFCETPAILYNVLNSNGNVMDKTKYPFYFVPKNKELKSQRCILLQLISSMDDYAYDLVWSGFLFENEIPPLLFRYITKENCPFTARLFADTRFGCHRSRPDHKAMRRIQHAAAYLAVTNDNAGYNSASGSHQESAQYDINPATNNFCYSQQLHANNKFAPITSLSVPLVSSSSSSSSSSSAAAATAASIGQKNCDTVNSMTASANVITNTVASNDSKRLLLDQSLMPSNPLPESISNNAGHVVNQFYSLSPILDNGSDFSAWNCYPAAGDIKVDNAIAKIPVYDERNNFHLIYPYSSPQASVADNYNKYSLETGTSSFLSFPASLSNLNCASSGNQGNQIHNFELNNSDMSKLQYNVSRMSFADGGASPSSTFATK
ncbi:BTG family protein [Brugia pahangi]